MLTNENINKNLKIKKCGQLKKKKERKKQPVSSPLMHTTSKSQIKDISKNSHVLGGDF